MRRRIVGRILPAAAILMAIVGSLDVLIQRDVLQARRAQQEAAVQSRTGSVRAYVEEVLTSDLRVVDVMAAYAEVHPDLGEDEFQAFAERIARDASTLRNLVLAPDLTIRHVYPLEGNQGILGVDYRDVPEQLPGVLQARDSGSLVLVGPLEVLQGGIGLLARAPVFVSDGEGAPEFWGIVASLIDVDQLISLIDPMIVRYGLKVAIRSNPMASGPQPVFYGPPELFDEPDAVRRDVSVPGGSWQIAAAPVDGWITRPPHAILIHGLALGVFTSGLLLIVGRLRRDERIRESEEQVRANAALLDLFFRQGLDGFFFMMLDEPIEWHDGVDKEATLDWVFEHQRVTKVNRAILEQYRATEEEFLGRTPADFFAHDPQAGRQIWRQFFDTGSLHIDTNERRFDGSDMTVEGDYITIRDAAGRITGHFGIQRDVSVQRDAEAQLKRYIDIVDRHVITSQTDLSGRITYASDAFARISGYSRQELIGEDHRLVRHPDTPEELFRDMWQAISSGRTWHGEIMNRRKDGSAYWVEADISALVDRHGTRYGYMSVRKDITAQKQLEVVSVTDPLTGLFNRQRLDAVLEAERSRFERYGQRYAVVLMDIDHFKRINDEHGHQQGDRVLTSVAETLRRSIRASDTVGRWGGEEFLIVCPHTDIDGAAALAEHLRNAVQALDAELPAPITASFGAAEVTIADTDDLVGRVDRALYRAKENGRNRVATASSTPEDRA